MRKIGPGDISYCSSHCCQENCKRNLRYWKPPTQYFSVSKFDKECDDETHIECEHKWLAEEEKKVGRGNKKIKSRKC